MSNERAVSQEELMEIMEDARTMVNESNYAQSSSIRDCNVMAIAFFHELVKNRRMTPNR